MWTDERVELLKILWAKGDSASQIATQIGGLTRNAVIGKVHRMGLPLRGPMPGTPRKRLKRVLVPAVRRAPPKSVSRSVRTGMPVNLPVDPTPLPGPNEYDDQRRAAGLVHLLDLEPDECRFAIGYDDKLGHGFCGCKTAPGLPYCEHHASRVYAPARVALPYMAPGLVKTLVWRDQIVDANISAFLQPA